MLVPIICAIVAIVGLITLISFNMVVREKESMSEEQPAPIQEQELTSKPEESEAEESVDVPEYEETTEETIADRDYRNALKRFQGKEESPAKTESRPQKMSDNAYREALRAMKKRD